MEHLLTNLSLMKIGLLVIGIMGVFMMGFMVYYICFAIIRISGVICSTSRKLWTRQGRESVETGPSISHVGITLPDGGHPKRAEREEETCIKNHPKVSMCPCCNCMIMQLTDSSCVKVGGHCQAIDVDNQPYTLCLGNAPASCPYSTLIADAHYCKCPIGHILVKNFYKDVDKLSQTIHIDRTSEAVSTQH